MLKLGDEIRTPEGNCIAIGFNNSYVECMDVNKGRHLFHERSCIPIDEALNFQGKLATWDEMAQHHRAILLRKMNFGLNASEMNWESVPREIQAALINKYGFNKIDIPIPIEIEEPVRFVREGRVFKLENKQDYQLPAGAYPNVSKYCKDCGDILNTEDEVNKHVEVTGHNIEFYKLPIQ